MEMMSTRRLCYVHEDEERSAFPIKFNSFYHRLHNYGQQNCMEWKECVSLFTATLTLATYLKWKNTCAPSYKYFWSSMCSYVKCNGIVGLSLQCHGEFW